MKKIRINKEKCPNGENFSPFGLLKIGVNC